MKFPIITKTFVLLFFCCAFTVSAQSPVESRNAFNNVVITLEQTAGERCYTCLPLVTIKILGNLDVNLEINDFVRSNYASEEGKKKITIKQGISRAQLSELINDFLKLKYFDLSDKYPEPGYTGMRSGDHGWTTTSFTINGKSKSVYNYFGAPKELDDLQNKIYDLSNAAKYRKKTVQTQ